MGVPPSGDMTAVYIGGWCADGAGAGGAVVLLLVVVAVIYMTRKAGNWARIMDPQAPGGEVTLRSLTTSIIAEGSMTTSRTFRGLTDSPSSAHIGPSGVGQAVVGTAVAPTGGALGARFDPNTGQPIPKFDPTTGKQNWDDGLGGTRR